MKIQEVVRREDQERVEMNEEEVEPGKLHLLVMKVVIEFDFAEKNHFQDILD